MAFQKTYRLGPNGVILENRDDGPWQTSGNQPVQFSTSSQLSGTTKFGLGIGALALLGRVPLPDGQRVFDKYISAVRTLEEYSPGRIFRTFQFSQMMSPLGTPSRVSRYFSPDIVRSLKASPFGETWFDQLENVIGKDNPLLDQINEQGFRFQNNQLFLGETGSDVLLKHASVVRSTAGSTPFFQEGYLRSLAQQDPRGLRTALTSKIPYLDASGAAQEEAFSIIGGQTKGQSVGRFLSGYGASLVERYNRLVKSPGEMFPGRIGKLFSKVGKHLAVPSGGGLQTLGRLGLKLGIGLPALSMGYDLLDWGVRKLPVFNNTLLDEGITGAGLQLWAKGQIALSTFAEYTGLHKLREAQETAAPGSTDIGRIAAFPLMGVIGGATFNYLRNIKNQFAYQAGGHTLEQSALMVQAEKSIFLNRLYGEEIPEHISRAISPKDLSFASLHAERSLAGLQGRIAKSIAETQKKRGFLGSVSRVLGKVTPTKLKSIFGGLIGLAAVAPFLPGALVPENRPEELEAIYSGEQYVPIRKGRWWESGRCLTISSTCKLIDGSSKVAKDIELGNILVSHNYEPAKVIGIYRRFYSGPIYKFATSLDRDIEIGLTPNHIIPVLRNDKIVEIQADEIEFGDFVEVPVKKNICSLEDETLNCLHFLQDETLVKNNKLYSIQKNWFTGKLQQSGKWNIPIKIKKDYDLGFLFGIYLAEGSVSFHKETPAMVETVHSAHEENLADRLIYLYSSIFGITATKRFKCDGKGVEGCFIVRATCSILAKLFRNLFYPPEYDAEEKRIPLEWKNSSVCFKTGLIDGYWTGDGHLDGNARVISSSRKWLVEDCQSFAFDIDLLSSLSYEHNEHKGKWKLRFCSSSPWATLKEFNGKVFARIKSIKIEEYIGEVVDFEVDHPDHLYCAGTFLIHNSPWSGGAIDRFVPHMIPRYLSRARDMAVYGGDYPEVYKFWKENFTYDLEKEHYFDRPYPQTAPAFSNVPLIGPILGATLGQVVKPVRMMHELGGDVVNEMPLRAGDRGPISELGEVGSGTPIDHYGIKSSLSEQVYRLKEMVGLPGFTAESIKAEVTGTEGIFDQETRYQSAADMWDASRDFYEEDLGGMLGLNEAYRRLFPRARKIPEWNAIPNSFSNVWWMPGAQERSPDFTTGDPFTKVTQAELRLPGPGYAQLHPELEGVDPNKYPLPRIYQILSDVAPYSDKFEMVKGMISGARKTGQLTEKGLAQIKEADRQRLARKEKKVFYDYKYRDENLSPVQTMLTAANEASKRAEGESWFGKTFGSYWETLAHSAETPFEFLTPFSPASKFIHMRTATEDYERTQVWGKESAFWQRPIQDFIKPFASSVTHALGDQDIPKEVQQKRNLEEYFDILDYVKNTRLKYAAEEQNNSEAASFFEAKRRETLFGINPFTQKYSSIFRALPRSERDYFHEFVGADLDEQKKILQMVPENEQALYLARWKLQEVESYKKAMQQGLLSEKQIQQAESFTQQMYEEKETEGLPKTQDLWQEYLGTRLQRESYPDWYRRTKLLQAKMVSLPGPSWVGWRPEVMLDDVKLKIVENIGGSNFDYDIWPDQMRQATKRPYLEGAIAPIVEQEQLNPTELNSRIRELLSANHITPDQISVVPLPGATEHRINLQFSEDREDEIRETIRRRGL